MRPSNTVSHESFSTDLAPSAPRRESGKRTLAQHLTASTMALGVAAAFVLASIGPADAAPLVSPGSHAAQAVAG